MSMVSIFIDDIKSLLFSFLTEFVLSKSENLKARILIYHVNGFSYGGTEKGLQFIAKNLNKDKFDVYFMSGERADAFGKLSKNDIETKKDELSQLGVSLIIMNYQRQMGPPSHAIIGANPSPRDVVKTLKIDLFITANMGYADYPIPLLNCPSIIIDVFGYGKTLSGKVKYLLPISEAVKKTYQEVISDKKFEVLPWPVPRPPTNLVKLRNEFRTKYRLNSEALVFGRIGRNDDSIFDPIAIKAFTKIVSENSLCYYVIVGPSESLKKIVLEKQIPNVILIQSIASEEDVWAFHSAIDVLAHYRLDGESQGVNIIESMAVGNPIISHKSNNWNAHLEYLANNFSFVAEVDDYEQYFNFMEYFTISGHGKVIDQMRNCAREVYETRFSPERYISRIDEIITKLTANKLDEASSENV